MVTCHIFGWHCLFLLNMPQRFRKCLLGVRTVTTLPHLPEAAVGWARLVILAAGFGGGKELEWVNPRHTAIPEGKTWWCHVGMVCQCPGYCFGLWRWLGRTLNQATKCLSEITSGWWNGLRNLLRSFLGLQFDLHLGCVNPLLWSLFLSLCRR